MISEKSKASWENAKRSVMVELSEGLYATATVHVIFLTIICLPTLLIFEIVRFPFWLVGKILEAVLIKNNE